MAGEDYTLSGLAVPDELDRLHDLLERAAAENPQVSAGDLMMLETAVMEVAGNVVEHGRPPGEVRWDFRLRIGKRLEAELRDSGEEYAGDASAWTAMPGELAEDGRGLPLATLALDELGYRRDGESNVWTMARELSR